jgi:hypothetical protein
VIFALAVRRALLIAICALALGGLAGCKNKCRALSEKLCDCSVNSLEKDACLRRASNEESRLAPTPEDELVCAELVGKCDCHVIDTPEGKRNCGLAR